MQKLLKKAKRDQERRENRPNVYKLSGWRSFLYYLYYRNRYFILRETGMWVLNFVELGLAAWLLGGMKVRGLALASRYVWLIYAMWGGMTLAERILVGRYLAARKPERIARTIATFIQLGFVVGIFAAGILFMSADVFVDLKPGEGNWPKILFQHRALLIIFELCSSSLFMGAYTIARMYRPLTLSFLLRLFVISLNIFLFPHFGPLILVITLYLRRLIDISITVYISRHWVFARVGIPRLPVFSLPGFNKDIIREMIPYISGRSLGMFFAKGYGVIITQLVSWILPGQVVFYVMFYQSLALLFMIPMRLGRCVFFDISHLLIWNRVGILKQYIKKIDKTAIVAGFIVAIFCLTLGVWGKTLSWSKLSVNFMQFRPLIFAAAVFLFFNPSNAVWQSVREAAGENKFNNWLLFITNYCIALPVSIYLLTHSSGVLHKTQHSSGLELLVVSHAMTLAWIIFVDGSMEAVRAIFSRFHIFRFKWVYDSPHRVTRSVMDAELNTTRGSTMQKSFSQDLSDLWIERYLNSQVVGTVSFPYWGRKVNSFIKQSHTKKRGFAVLRIILDFRFTEIWNIDGTGFKTLSECLRPVDSMCRISREIVTIFLPCVSDDEAKKIVANIYLKLGYYFRGCWIAHSSTHKLDSIWDIIAWASTGTINSKKNDEYKKMWDSVTTLFRFSHSKDETFCDNFRSFCLQWEKAKKNENEIGNFASSVWTNELSRILNKKVQWYGPDEFGAWESPPFDDFETNKIVERSSKIIEETHIPNFKRFLRADARCLLPVYFRTNLVGAFYFEPNDIQIHSQLVRYAAAIYLWLTVRSIINVNWEDTEGYTMQPIFEEALSNAKQFNEFFEIPYTHIQISRHKWENSKQNKKKIIQQEFNVNCLLMRKRKTIELLVEGVSKNKILEVWKNKAQ